MAPRPESIEIMALHGIHDVEAQHSPLNRRLSRSATAIGVSRSKSIFSRIPLSQSPYRLPPPPKETTQPFTTSTLDEPPRPFNLGGSLSQTTIAENPVQALTSDHKGELVLQVRPLPYEAPAEALTRSYSLSGRDVDILAQHLCLSPEQRQKLPRAGRPIDLQHHIQTELLRRVHLGLDIGDHHQGHHRRFFLEDNPFTFEIRDQKSPCHHGADEDKHLSGSGKYAFKKPVADLSDLASLKHSKKSATWMELFFDLTFVANITIFTHQHPIVDMTTLLRYCGWFTILWWMWLSQTMFDVRFSTDDLLNRIWKLIQLFALAGFAGNSNRFTNSNSSGFALSYAVMKLVLIGQYFIVWIHAPDKRSRRPILLYMVANFISFVMWWASAFLIDMLSDQARYSIWFSAIGIEILVNIGLSNNDSVTFAGSHLPERLGLFTLIVLGESIMGLFMVTDDLVTAPGKLGWDNLTLLIFSITIVKCQWFLYFDDYHEQGPVRSSVHSVLWTYLHFMLNLSQLLLGVGCIDLIRIFQQDKELPSFLSHMETSHPTGASGAGKEAAPGEEGSHELISMYTKKYFLIVAANVFLWNAAIKWVTSRPGEKFDRAIYISRLVMAIVVVCLLLVEHHRLSAFSLLGLGVGFSLLQVGSDLLVLYYAARRDFQQQQHLY